MTLVVGWRPFPWHCSSIKCNSTKLAIYPGEESNDPQQIRVVCQECGNEYYTSGEVMDVDVYMGRVRDFDQLNPQEIKRLLDQGAITQAEIDRRDKRQKEKQENVKANRRSVQSQGSKGAPER